jgi:protein-disulfide isomerase
MANTSRRERLRAAQEADRRRRRVRTFAAVVMLVMAFGSAPQAATRPPNGTAASDGIVVYPGKATQGSPVVGLYLDYQCSHCVQFEDKFGLTLDDLAGKGEIQLINHTKVFLDRGNNEGLSHKAAIAAACSDSAGVYNAFHQGIFAAALNGPYTDELLRVQLPQTTGITGAALTAYQSCYDTRAMLGWVNGVEEASAKAGVNETPTMKINGKTIDLTTLPSDVNQLRQFILDNA